MDTKLTLKLSKKAIERAKRYAKKHNQSLSGLVERYFEVIAEKETASEIEISPNVLGLSGIIKLPVNYDIKDAYRKHIEDKYSR